jgi:hypothetical protein
MKALDPQRLRMVLSFFFLVLFVAALFVATHLKAGVGVVLACALGAAFFLIAGIRALYSLTSDPN